MYALLATHYRYLRRATTRERANKKDEKKINSEKKECIIMNDVFVAHVFFRQKNLHNLHTIFRMVDSFQFYYICDQHSITSWTSS